MIDLNATASRFLIYKGCASLNAKNSVRKLQTAFMLLPLILLACSLERRNDFNFTVDQPMRCGIFKSYFFVREVKEEIYPDLGMLIANAAKLNIEGNLQNRLIDAARGCTEECEVAKDNLRLIQEEIKRKLALNEIKGDLSKVASDVRRFETAKKNWLRDHSRRYNAGLAMLPEITRVRWQKEAARFLVLSAEP